MTARYPNSFREFFRSLFRMPTSFGDFWRMVIAQQPYLGAIIGAIFFVVGGYMELSQRWFVSNSIPVEAKIIKIDKKRSDSHFLYRPVLEIRKPDGSTYQYKGNIWTSPNPHQEGEIVQAHYSRNDGRVMSLQVVSQVYFAARAIALIGALVFIGSLFWLWIRKRKRGSS